MPTPPERASSPLRAYPTTQYEPIHHLKDDCTDDAADERLNDIQAINDGAESRIPDVGREATNQRAACRVDPVVVIRARL